MSRPGIQTMQRSPSAKDYFAKRKNTLAPHLIVEALAGTGKCLGSGTQILMYDGSIKIVEDIEKGDLLMGPDSQPRKVLSISNGEGQMYIICPVKGEVWHCNGDHILTLVGTNYKMGQTIDISVNDYLKLSNNQRRCWKLWRTGVEFPKQPTLTLPPYLMGLWMGDGAKDGSVIHNGNPTIHKYCKHVAKELQLDCMITPDERHSMNTSRVNFAQHVGNRPQTGNQFRSYVRRVCVVNGLKIIPEEYLTASREDRLELLAGIMDTDGGGHGVGNATAGIGVTGEPYRDSLLRLIRSLGLAAYSSEVKEYGHANGKVSRYYDINVSGDLTVVPTKVRKYAKRKQIKRVNVTGFKIYQHTKPKETYYGFTLDGDGRFLLGDFTVTHNTTTLIEGLKLIKGMKTTIKPSSQQAAVWEAMQLSKDARSVCFVAFNKSIATELQAKVPVGCNAMTMHSMGLKAVTAAYGRLGDPNQYRTQDIIADIYGRDIRELRKSKFTMIKATCDLTSKVKMNLANLDENGDAMAVDDERWGEILHELAGFYDIELNGSEREVYGLVPQVIERCADVMRDRQIDYDDMIWLPVVNKLPMHKYDLLLVDEAQDQNRCQQELSLKAGNRLILVGDRNQAIYGFAGADCESMERMEGKLSSTERGCKVLPLTVTRRCGKLIVEEAKRIVPNFEAMDDAPDGTISYALYEIKEKGVKTYHDQVRDGDMVLCRVNAPLVSQCFRFLKEGRKANIQGRDIGQGLVRTINKLRADDVADLVGKLSDWFNEETRKENAKRNPNEHRLMALQDRFDCLQVFCEDCKTVQDVIDRIERVFTDDKTTGIRFSSIHRAKGLESKRVFLLQPKGAAMPHPMARTPQARKQEAHLEYVAVSRAIEELVFVS